MKRKLIWILTSGLLFVLVCVPAQPSGASPTNFFAEVTNKFFPLNPGTRFFYEGEKDGIPASDEVFVTRQTKVILGVSCTVVSDQAFENGKLVEDTVDWYAQDTAGNVWYFGEDTKELDPDTGQVISTEGSWEAGVNGAQQGIIMEAQPQAGDRYQQELAPDVAEDMARVLSLDESQCVRYGCFDNLLLTKEWSPLDKGVVEQKYYAANVGFILGVRVKG